MTDNPTQDPLRILHIDDSPLDAELIREQLADFEQPLLIDWVASKDEYAASLQSNSYDLVLADYNVPGYDAPEALVLARSRFPDLPFICVSGAIGEEKAVELLKIGATDYVLKGRLEKLPLALRRALSERREQRTRQRAETSLSENEEQHRNILLTAMDGYWLTDKEGRLLEANSAYCRMSGYTLEELLALSITDLEAVENIAMVRQHLQTLIDRGDQRFESRHRRKDGSVYEVEISAQYRPVQGGRFIVFIQDITERKLAISKTLASLEEKETLIRELYHRTRNTLQVIRGILVLQADEFPLNPELQQLVKSTETRIQVISMVHQQLYTTKDLSHIELRPYIHELGAMILASFEIPAQRIKLDLQIDDCTLLLDSAIPLGLVLHELISNSLEHAFPGDRPGTISIALQQTGGETYVLRYADDGVGVAPGLDFRSLNTLGTKLIFGIAEQQLAGKVEVRGVKGFACVITFKTNLYKARV